MSHPSTSPPPHPHSHSPPLPSLQSLSLGTSGEGDEYRYAGLFGPNDGLGGGTGAGAWASPVKGSGAGGFGAGAGASWFDPLSGAGRSGGSSAAAFGLGYGQSQSPFQGSYRQPTISTHAHPHQRPHSPPTLSPPSSSTSAPTTSSSLAPAQLGSQAQSPYASGMYSHASGVIRGLGEGFDFEDPHALEAYGMGFGGSHSKGQGHGLDQYGSTPSPPPPGAHGGTGPDGRPAAGVGGGYQPFSSYDHDSPDLSSFAGAGSNAFSSRMHAPSPSSGWRRSPAQPQPQQGQSAYSSTYASSGYPSAPAFGYPSSYAAGPPSGSGIPTPSDDVIPTAIVIKNIPFSVPRDSLLSIISSLGAPLPYAFNYHTDSGVFRGLAFANFRAPEEAQSVVAALNGYDVQGRKLRVEYKKVLQPGEKDKIEREKALKRMRSIQFDGTSGGSASANGYGGSSGGYGGAAGAYGGFSESRESRALRDAQDMPPPPLPASIQTSSLRLPHGSNGGLSPPPSASAVSASASSSSGFGPAPGSSVPGSGLHGSGASGSSSQAGSDPEGEAAGEPLTLDLNDATTLSIYSSVLVFKEDRMRDELAFSRTLSGAERRLVGLVAKKLGLLAVTRTAGPGADETEGKIVVVVREGSAPEDTAPKSQRFRPGALNHSASAYLQSPSYAHTQDRGQAYDPGYGSAHGHGADRAHAHSRGYAYGQPDFGSSGSGNTYPYSPLQPSHAAHSHLQSQTYPSPGGGLKPGYVGVPGAREPSPAHSHSSAGSVGRVPPHLRIKKSMPDLRGFSGPAVARDPNRSLTPQRSSGNLRDWAAGAGGTWGGVGGGKFGGVFGRDLGGAGAGQGVGERGGGANGHAHAHAHGPSGAGQGQGYEQNHRPASGYRYGGLKSDLDLELPEHPGGETEPGSSMSASLVSPANGSGVVRNPRGPTGESRGFGGGGGGGGPGGSSASTSPGAGAGAGAGAGPGPGGLGSVSSDTLRADARDFAGVGVGGAEGTGPKGLRGSVSLGAGLKGGP